MSKRHRFCAQHQQTYPIESSCPKCRAAANVMPFRQIATIARRMERMHGWPRRRAIEFAAERVKRNPNSEWRTDRRELSDDTRQYLDHRNRSTSR